LFLIHAGPNDDGSSQLSTGFSSQPVCVFGWVKISFANCFGGFFSEEEEETTTGENFKRDMTQASEKFDLRNRR
jgi:hypothetical protein